MKVTLAESASPLLLFLPPLVLPTATFPSSVVKYDYSNHIDQNGIVTETEPLRYHPDMRVVSLLYPISLILTAIYLDLLPC